MNELIKRLEAAEYRNVYRLQNALADALSHELNDTEIEDAMKSEGIYTWGPDGERFERMFAVVMKLRGNQPLAALKATQ